MDIDMSDPNRLLTSREAGELVGMSAKAFNNIPSRPEPDDPDLERPANRRQLRWKLSTVVEWERSRVKRPRKRKEPDAVPGQDD